MITTYGVFGKVEFVISLAVGIRSIPIDFEGGSINSRGVVPASYTTNSPIIQRAIESTPEFKHGIIKKTRSIPEESDMIISQKIKESRENVMNEKIASTSESPEDNISSNPEEKNTPDLVVNVTGQTSGKEDAEDKKEIKVTCTEDAVEYLKAHFDGYTSSKLRSKASIENAATEHGIVFVGL